MNADSRDCPIHVQDLTTYLMGYRKSHASCRNRRPSPIGRDSPHENQCDRFRHIGTGVLQEHVIKMVGIKILPAQSITVDRLGAFGSPHSARSSL